MRVFVATECDWFSCILTWVIVSLVLKNHPPQNLGTRQLLLLALAQVTTNFLYLSSINCFFFLFVAFNFLSFAFSIFFLTMLFLETIGFFHLIHQIYISCCVFYLFLNHAFLGNYWFSILLRFLSSNSSDIYIFLPVLQK